MSKTQKKILSALGKLPDKIEPEELEAMICALVSAYVGFDETPEYLLYLHLKTNAVRDRLMAEAERETKH